MPTEGNADAKGITGFVTKVMIHEMAPEDYMGGLVHRADSLLFELTTDYDGVPDEHGILFIEDVTSKLTILERAKKDPSFKSELDRVAPEGSGLLIRATEYGLIPQGTKMYIREVPPASTECKYFCITM
jgi:hypothetical protein